MERKRCLSKNRHGDDCTFRCLGDTSFCKFHQYMISYSKEMLEKLELCNGCKKMYYFANEQRTCENCRERAKSNKVKQKETVILCSKEGCKFKRSKDNDYCGKHQICLFEDETKELNKKLCYNYIRGCRSQLEIDYGFSRCPECLEKERKHDRERRRTVENTNTDPPLENVIRTSKYCTTCCRDLPFDKFIGTKMAETRTCNDCRENNKKQDAKRDKEHRNAIARKNDAKPERKEVKKEWNENNYEKVALKTINYRQRQMEENQEGYLIHNAEMAKKWRENNPEKMIEANENKKNSKEINYSNYKRNANMKNLDFSINYDEYCNIVTKECYYCGIIQERGFNGIDRKDQTKGYILDNCSSCCKMCNYMKGSTSDEVFIKRVEHILTFQGKIDENLYPECFANHKSSLYCQYRNRAIKKQLDFLLTPEDYNVIIKKECYMCGKKTDQHHQNGIDRMDNTKGYTLENVNACCCECNFVKKDYLYEELINKMVLIYAKNRDKPEKINTENENNDSVKTELLEKTMIFNEIIKNNTTISPPKNKLNENNRHMVPNKNKKTKEEIKEANRLYKQKQREKMKEKYGNEEYKKKRAQEIADSRSKKKEKSV